MNAFDDLVGGGDQLIDSKQSKQAGKHMIPKRRFK